MNLRKIMVLAAAVAALAAIPAQASAKQSLPEGVFVCHVGHGTGDLVVLTDGDYADPQGASIPDGLAAKKNGNLNAAMHSPVMALCGLPDTTGGWGGIGG
jgi:ABC-type amino acid transport substrate-binding protein